MMADNIIDLRKKDLSREPAPAFPSASVPPETASTKHSAPVLTALPEKTQESKEEDRALLEWSAYEYENPERGPYWALKIGAAAVALIILGIFSQSYFFIAFVLLAFVTLLMYSRRAPQKISFAVTRNGVKAGGKFYKFADLKSFWILDRNGTKELSLETEKTLSPILSLPLGNAPAEKIKELLLKVLPEMERRELMSDHISRALKL